jgi:hypothetical protein
MGILGVKGPGVLLWVEFALRESTTKEKMDFLNFNISIQSKLLITVSVAL